MANFFARKDNAIIFTGDGELLYYVPEEYFSLKAAVPKGEYIDVIGIFTYALFDKYGKRILLKRFKCPKMITCKPFEITKDSNFHLEGTRNPAAYRILRFHKGDELISSVFVTQGMDDVEKTLNLLITAHWPDDIPYDEIQDYLIKNTELCGFNYGVSAQNLGIIISELYRDPKELSKPFRTTDMSNMTDYKQINIKAVPKYTSPYTAITSENADEAIAAAMTTKGTTKSPLEDIMMS
jgi:hypothetical protein